MKKHNYHILVKDKEDIVLLYDCVKKDEYPKKYKFWKSVEEKHPCLIKEKRETENTEISRDEVFYDHTIVIVDNDRYFYGFSIYNNQEDE